MDAKSRRSARALLGGLLVLFSVNVALAGIRPDDPETLKRTKSLGDLIAATTRNPVHIVYVHGMRADGTGASTAFQAGLCKHVAGLCAAGSNQPRSERTYLDIGPRPAATYLDQPIWRNDDEWKGSTPFVDRYVFKRQNAEPIVIDEVNWWPLLFPVKCRMILVPETDLSGADKAHLKLCAQKEAPYYPWLTGQELEGALRHKPTSGGGAWANSFVKQQIMNWGLTDAAMALGPLRTYFRRTMNLAFERAAHFDDKDIDHQEFVVISESLGSFVVLDAFNNLFEDSKSAEQVGLRTTDLYFFANQFALLQLGRIDGLPAKTEGGPGLSAPVVEVSPIDLLKRWAQTRRSGGKLEGELRPKQVLAFSDPSDILTYRVPKLRDGQGNDFALVVNLYDRNEWNWFGLFALPTTAHTGHSSNPDVLKQMFHHSQ
jgi:hypothetical protein